MFKNTGRGLQLTEIGKTFLTDIESIMAQVEELRKKYSSPETAQANAALMAGGTYGPSASVLPLAMIEFKKRQPHIELQLHTGRSEDIENRLLQSHLDLAVIANPFPSTSLHMEPFREEAIAVFVSRTHPLAKRGRIDVKEFVDLPLVIRSTRTGPLQPETLVQRMLQQGFKPNIVMRCESPDAVKTGVRNHIGVGILHYDVIGPAIKEGAFRAIEVPGLDLRQRSYIVYSNERPLSETAEQFLLLLRRACKQNKLMIASSPS